MKKAIAILVLAMMLVVSFAQAEEEFDFTGTWMFYDRFNDGSKRMVLLDVTAEGEASLIYTIWDEYGILESSTPRIGACRRINALNAVAVFYNEENKRDVTVFMKTEIFREYYLFVFEGYGFKDQVFTFERVQTAIDHSKNLKKNND